LYQRRVEHLIATQDMTDLLLTDQKISKLMCSSKITKRITWNLQFILELDIVSCRRSY